jgi:hypothetical protein
VLGVSHDSHDLDIRFRSVTSASAEGSTDCSPRTPKNSGEDFVRHDDLGSFGIVLS